MLILALFLVGQAPASGTGPSIEGLEISGGADASGAREALAKVASFLRGCMDEGAGFGVRLAIAEDGTSSVDETQKLDGSGYVDFSCVRRMLNGANFPEHQLPYEVAAFVARRPSEALAQRMHAPGELARLILRPAPPLSPPSTADPPASLPQPCPPWAPKERGLRFPYGIPKETTAQSLEMCQHECRERDGSFICSAANADGSFTIHLPRCELDTVSLAYDSPSPNALLYGITLFGRYDSCDDAAAALADLHGLVRAQYAPKGTTLTKGPLAGTRQCRDLMKEGNAFLRSDNREWRVTADIFYLQGTYFVYLDVTNKKNRLSLDARRAVKVLDDLIDAAKKL